MEISAESFWEKGIHSLELSTLEDVADIGERSICAESGISNLTAERSGTRFHFLTEKTLRVACRVEMDQSKLWEADLSETEMLPRKARVKGDFKDIGWSSVLEVICGFEPVAGLNREIHFGVALKNNLPVPLPVHSISAHFLEHKGQSRILKFEDAHSVDLKARHWKEFMTSFVPAVHGEMRAEFIEIRFAPHASLAWYLRLSSKGSHEQTNSEEEHTERLPFRESIICPGLHSIRIKHVGASPTLTVGLQHSLGAFTDAPVLVLDSGSQRCLPGRIDFGVGGSFMRGRLRGGDAQTRFEL